MISAAERDACMALMDEMSAYLTEQIELKRAQPGDDIMTALVQATDEGDRLTTEELLAQLITLYVAGHEPTTSLIGNGLLHLLEEPDQLAALRHDPAQLPHAINELLRFDGPNQFVRRITLEPMVLSGQEVPAGAVLYLCVASANRDADHFGPDADRLRIDRPDAAQHLQFGAGIHNCLGNHLARLQAEIALGRADRPAGRHRPGRRTGVERADGAARAAVAAHHLPGRGPPHPSRTAMSNAEPTPTADRPGRPDQADLSDVAGDRHRPGVGRRPLHRHLGRLPRRRPTSPTTAPYLEAAYLDDFDAWAAAFANPYDDLKGGDGGRNWDHDRRLAELEADGVVAEVMFPNTIPPFFPKSSLVYQPPGLDGRRPRACAGPGCGPTTAGWPSSARRRPAGGPASPRSCCTTSTPRWPRSAGPPTAGLTGGVLLPGVPARLGPAPALRARLRADLGDLRGAGRSRQHPQRQHRPRLRRLPRGQA